MKWHYMIIKHQITVLQEEEDLLDDMGRRGWELAAVAAVKGGTTFLYFKQPLEEKINVTGNSTEKTG